MQVLNHIRLFWGWVFPYINLTHSLCRWVSAFLGPEILVIRFLDLCFVVCFFAAYTLLKFYCFFWSYVSPEILSFNVMHITKNPRSGGFRLLTRQNISWESLEITFRQDGLVQNRLLKREDFVGRGRQRHLHMAAVNSLKNLRHLNVMVLFCFFNVN